MLGGPAIPSLYCARDGGGRHTAISERFEVELDALLALVNAIGTVAYSVSQGAWKTDFVKQEVDHLDTWGVAGAAKASAQSDMQIASQYLKRSYTGLQALQKELGARGRMLAQSEGRADLVNEFTKAMAPHTYTTHQANIDVLDGLSMMPGLTGAAASFVKAVIDFKDGRILSGFEDALGAIPGEKLFGNGLRLGDDLLRGVHDESSILRFTGETESTAAGRASHGNWSDQARHSGNYDLVDQYLTDAEGKPIRVPRRVDLETGQPRPGTRMQRVRPDGVSFGNDEIVDLKPENRPMSKDRQQMIRYINAYKIRTGHLPKVIKILRTDANGNVVREEDHSPDDFLPHP